MSLHEIFGKLSQLVAFENSPLYTSNVKFYIRQMQMMSL